VVIYQTGYVTYGIEDGGNKVNLTIIKMPKGPFYLYRLNRQ